MKKMLNVMLSGLVVLSLGACANSNDVETEKPFNEEEYREELKEKIVDEIDKEDIKKSNRYIYDNEDVTPEETYKDLDITAHATTNKEGYFVGDFLIDGYELGQNRYYDVYETPFLAIGEKDPEKYMTVIYDFMEYWYQTKVDRYYNTTDADKSLTVMNDIMNIAYEFNASSPRTVYSYHLDLNDDKANVMSNGYGLHTNWEDAYGVYTANLAVYDYDSNYTEFVVMDSTNDKGEQELNGLTKADLYMIPAGFIQEEQTFKVLFVLIGIDNAEYSTNTAPEEETNQEMPNFEAELEVPVYELINIAQNIATDTTKRAEFDSYMEMATGCGDLIQVVESTIETLDVQNSAYEINPDVFYYSSSYNAVLEVNQNTNTITVISDPVKDNIQVLVIGIDDFNSVISKDPENWNPIMNLLSDNDLNGSLSARRAVMFDKVEEDGITYNFFYTELDYLN